MYYSLLLDLKERHREKFRNIFAHGICLVQTYRQFCPTPNCKHVPEAAMFFYVNNDVISMRLHNWSTGGLLLVYPPVVSAD